MLALRSNHDAIRMHQIGNRTAFTQKLRITNNIELCAVAIVSLDRFSHFFACLYRHRALVDNYPIVSHYPRDFPRDFLEKTKIDIAIWLLGSGNGDKNDLRVVHAFLDAAGETQSLGGDIAMNYFFKAGLIYRHVAALQQFDLLRVVIDANDVMADIGEARTGHKTNVTRTDNCKIHKRWNVAGDSIATRGA